MRQHVEALNRQRRENFERSARQWAIDNGWTPPEEQSDAYPHPLTEWEKAEAEAT